MTVQFTMRAYPTRVLRTFTVTFIGRYSWLAKGSTGWVMDGGFRWSLCGVYAYSNQSSMPGSASAIRLHTIFHTVLTAVTSLKRLQRVQKRKHRVRMRLLP
jgi:hypothetical protein